MTTSQRDPRLGATSPTRVTTRENAQTRSLLHRLHFFAGMICAPFILVAALTGFFYALAPTIEQATNQDILTVQSVGTEKVPVSQLVQTAREEHPDLTLAGVRLGKPDQTTRVLFSDPNLPESTLQAVFLDPYTGEVKGDTTQYGSSAALPFRQWLSEGHRNLWLGEPGRLYSEMAASWMGVLAVGGVVMLWRRQRGKNKLKGMLRIDGAGRAKTVRLHNATGTVISLGLVFLTITGLTWSSVAGENIGNIRQALSWTTPVVSMDLPGSHSLEAMDPHAGHEGHMAHEMMAMGPTAASIDRVAATAERELTAPVTITPPTAEGKAWRASENRGAYRFSLDTVAVDGSDGDVTQRLNFSEWPFMAKLTSWLIDAHMGLLLGLPNQIVLAVLAAGIVAMIVWGYLMWWKRRPAGALAAPPRRAKPSRPSLGTVVLSIALIAYGLLAPVFGVTCLAFIVGSWLWGKWRPPVV